MVRQRQTLAPADSAGLRSETVRSANLSTILRLIHFEGPLSRSELVARTGLTRSAIGALIGELVRSGYILEHRAVSDGSPGRPSPVATVIARRNVALSVEVAVDSLAVAAVGLGGTVLHSIRVDRTRDRASVETTIYDIVEMIREVQAPLDPGCRVLGLGVGIVGLVRKSDSSVPIAPNLGWREIAFGERLQAALGGDIDVVMANDADVAALAELRRGVAVGVDDVFFVWGEVGVGGGLVCGGEMVTGRSGFAGEVGHLTVNPDGRPCQCGSIGCWETEVGEGALLRRVGRDVDGGREAVDAALADALGGNEVALEALDQEARWLGIGVAGLVNVLNPSMVVLGGLFGRIFPFIEARLREEVDRRALPSAALDLQIVPSALGIDGALLGAAELAFERALGAPIVALRELGVVAGNRTAAEIRD